MAPAAVPAPELHPPRPLLHHFGSVDDWLRAWVEFRRAALPPAHRSSYDRETGRPSVSLVGSIGLDSAITVEGDVWVQFGIHDDELDGWRPAQPNERVALLISAQRPYPELAVLLPLRPAEATDCRACAATGRTPVGSWCFECGARGWLVAGHDFSLEAFRDPGGRGS